MKKISIISPVHQNEAYIEDFVKSIYKEIISDLKKKKYKYEVLLAEDGSTDRTKEILKKLSKQYKFKLMLDKKKLGYAKAAKNLIKKADGDIVFFLDSDGEIHPRSFWKLFKLMETNKYDLVNGFKQNRKPIYRFFISRINNFLLRLLFQTGVRDANAGCKMYRKDIMKLIIDKCSLKYNFNAEQLIRLRRKEARIAEVGVPHFARESVVFKPNKLVKILILAVIELLMFRLYLWQKGDSIVNEQYYV